MKKNHRRTWKIGLVMVLGITALSTIGFSSWAVVRETSAPTAAIHMEGAEVVETIPGIAITTEPLKLGTYFYEEGSGNARDNTSVGYLKYTFTTTPASLPNDFKTSNDKYAFALSGTITFSDFAATNLFGTDFVDSALSVSDESSNTEIATQPLTPVSVVSNSINYCSASIAFSVIITDSAASTFTIGIGFKQKLLLSETARHDKYRDLLLDSDAKFTLRLSGGAIDD